MFDSTSLAAGERGGIRPSIAARGVRGAITLAFGALGAFLLMAHDARLAWGVPLGALAIAIATIGALDLAWRRDGAAASAIDAAALGPSLGALVASALAFCMATSAVARGLIPQWLGGAAISAAYVAGLASLFHVGQRLGPWRVDEAGDARPLLRRHGFWLTLTAGLLFLPTLGASSLWDPWETHYGEVAREILVRDDWVSLWWAHEGFFYSKPVLVFWTQAIAMAVLGVDVAPGHVLLGGAHPEWVVRMPNALCAILGLYVLYCGARKAFGRRAALFGGLVLATMPHYFLLAHQSTTDMPFVATMSASMGLLLIGLCTDGDALVREHAIRIGARTYHLSAWHLCIGAIVACALPQAIHLVTRNVELVLHASGAHGFRPHLDEFRIGSGGGNCGEPGNVACGARGPAHRLQPIAQGIAWIAGLALVVWMNRGERRARRIYFLGAWLFAALATLAKGPAGLGLPVLCALVYIVSTKRWRALAELEIPSGVLIVAVVALPWYIAAFVRHGSAFTDELIFNDMINRAFSHVHDTNEGEDTSFRYYLAQLGYGTFPWIGLAPLGLGWWMRNDDTAKGGASILFAMWFLFAFALFSMMGTKFHHYIFPAVPPLAVLIGVVLDDALASSDDDAVASSRERTHHARMLGAAALGGALLVALVGRDLAAHPLGESDGAIRFAQLFSYQYRRPWPKMLDFHVLLAGFAIAATLATALFATRLRRFAVLATTAIGIAFAAWGGATYLTKTAPHWGQGSVIRAYYASRASDAEPLVAYQLNWKGENFYTGNRLATFVSTGAPFTSWIREERDHGTKVVYFVLEHSRVGSLKSEAHARAWQTVTTQDESHQFVLVRAELTMFDPKLVLRRAAAPTFAFPLAAAAIPALLFFALPPIAHSGLWDPRELETLDAARRVHVALDAGLPTACVALGLRLFGLHDWAGRLPLAAIGVVGAFVTYAWVARLVDRRAGLYAAIALATTPLFFVGARTVLGDVVTMSASSAAFGGLAVAILADATPRARAAWLALAAGGLAAGLASRGAILGIAVPCIAIACAGRASRRASPIVPFALAAIAIVASLAGWRALVATSPGDFSMLAGVRIHPPAHAPPFDRLVAHAGHALFPWSALAPFALGRLFFVPATEDAERESRLRAALVVGAAFAIAAHAVLAAYADLVPFSAPALVAAACAIAIRDVERGARPSSAAAVGSVLLALVLGHDWRALPEKAFEAFGTAATFPRALHDAASRTIAIALAAFAVTLVAAWIDDPRAPPSRFAKILGRAPTLRVASVVVAGAIVCVGYYPALADEFSSRSAFRRYGEAHAPGEPLALLGVNDRAATYYAEGATPTTVADPTRAIDWLTAPDHGRRFVAAAADTLPRLNAIHRTRARTNVPVLEMRDRALLVTSALHPGEVSVSPLDAIVLDEAPPLAHRVDANLDDRVIVLGYELLDAERHRVETIAPRRRVHLRTYYRVLAPVGADYTVFVHIDGQGRRHNGDHPIAQGLYPTSVWQAGDVIVDEYELTLGASFTPGSYTFFMGLYAGGASGARLRVKSGPADNEDRVRAGVLRVE